LSLATAAALSAAAPMETPLSGEQDGDFETGNYIVTGTVVVKRGKTLSFSPGCIVRFKRYTGIVVEGTMKCKGTSGLPIMFTSDNHRTSDQGTANPLTPFDWTGIVVVDSMGVLDFEFTHVLYATFGLDVRSGLAKVRLKNAYFDENGQFNVRINGNQLDVKENSPVFFFQGSFDDEMPSSAASPDSGRAKSAVAENKPEEGGFKGDWEERPRAANQKPVSAPKVKTASKKNWRFPARIGAACCAAAGGVIGIYYNSEVVKFQKRYDAAGDMDVVAGEKKWRDRAKTRRDAGYIVGLIGACGLGLTFVF
jgi:hypothetical protein